MGSTLVLLMHHNQRNATGRGRGQDFSRSLSLAEPAVAAAARSCTAVTTSRPFLHVEGTARSCYPQEGSQLELLAVSRRR